MVSLNKNILAVSWAMPPLLLPRALQISRVLKQWAAHGWKTQVLTVNPDCLGDSVVLDHQLSGLYQDAYTAVAVDSPERSFFFRAAARLAPKLRERPDEKRIWADRAAKKGIALHTATPFSILVSFAQPWSSHIAGLKIHQKTGLPWVAHFSDPWVVGSHAKMSTGAMREAREWESRIVYNATRLVFVNQETANATLANYPADVKKKARVVAHGFDRDVLKLVSGPSPKQNSVLRLVHSGNFYGNRTPWTFLQALADLNNTTPLTQKLEVVFVGNVPPDFRKKAIRMGLSEVIQTVGPKTYLQALGYLQEADVLLMIEAPNEQKNLYFPSKLVDYFLFQKPILGLTPAQGPSVGLLQQLGCPIVEPNDAAGIQNAIRTLLELKTSGKLKPSEAFAQTIATYDVQQTATAFEAILSEVKKS